MLQREHWTGSLEVQVLTLYLPAAVSFPTGHLILLGVVCPLTGWTDQGFPHCSSLSPRGPPKVFQDLVLE